jgi:hypothetical protein
MNPGDLCIEFHYFETKEEACVILERCGEFPKWIYKVLTPNGVKMIPSGGLRRVLMYEAW